MVGSESDGNTFLFGIPAIFSHTGSHSLPSVYSTYSSRPSTAPGEIYGCLRFHFPAQSLRLGIWVRHEEALAFLSIAPCLFSYTLPCFLLLLLPASHQGPFFFLLPRYGRWSSWVNRQWLIWIVFHAALHRTLAFTVHHVVLLWVWNNKKVHWRKRTYLFVHTLWSAKSIYVWPSEAGCLLNAW